ncbi:transposase [Streptomyces bacillaris]|uniref:transposase n=1 Tax=Streptomyces bacillaris TaxID=68179 RepID=UPI003F5C2D5F
MRLAHHVVRKDPFAGLSRFRGEFCSCLTRRADALLELADAVLCADGLVRSLVELSLVGEHRRGHGGLYDALSAGRGDIVRLRRALAAVPLPRSADRRLVLAADLTYEEVFRATAGPLDKAQANKQRPLWASTGVKDTLYVDDLDAIKKLGISYDDVVQVLEDEGIEKFAASCNDLLKSTEAELSRLTPSEASA